jgi:predicted transcriptional regulator
MRILQENPDLTQRELAEKLGMNVAGLNYCLNALIDKGLGRCKTSLTARTSSSKCICSRP